MEMQDGSGEPCSRAQERVQLVKRLLHEYEDLSSIPGAGLKILVW